jgi:hypothetical protein
MHDMKIEIEIEIDDAVAEDVNRFLATAGQNETSTHGALDMPGLVQMLLQDGASPNPGRARRWASF